MGRAKALLDAGGETFVARTIRIASEAVSCRPILVCGSDAPAVRAAVGDASVTIVENPRWESGIGSSIARGIEAVAAGDAAGALILLIDQPGVSAGHLQTLVAAFRAGADPVATSYEGRPGVPALFGRRWFEDLLRLDGDRGAREILERAGAAVVEPETGLLDVDTPEDYERFAH